MSITPFRESREQESIIAWIVLGVCILDDNYIPRGMGKCGLDRTSLARVLLMPYNVEPGIMIFGENPGSRIGGAIVNRDDFGSPWRSQNPRQAIRKLALFIVDREEN